MAGSIKKNAFYNVLLNISQVIFPLITAPYVSRVLEPDGVGLFNFANTYAGYFALVALLGIPTYGVREVAKARDDKESLSMLVSQLMTIAVMTTVVVSAVYLITIAVVGQLTENYIIFLLAGFVIYLAPFKINWYYQGLEEFGFITMRSLILRTLGIICLFVFVRTKSDLVIYIIISVLTGILADIWNFTRMWMSGVRPRLTSKGLRQHIKPLLILFASSVAISIYTVLDTIMLGFIKDYEEVGYYSNAMHMSRILVTAVASLSLVAVPRVSYYMKNKDYDNINRFMNKSLSVVAFLAFPTAIGLSCIAPTFIPLFFGDKYMGAIIPLMILSMLIIVIGFNNLTGMQILIGMGLDKLFLYSVLTGTVSNFLMNCILIPMYGANGASVASVSAELLILIVMAYFVYRHTPIRLDRWVDILKAFAGTVVFFPLLILLEKVLDGWYLVGGFVLSGALVYVLIEALLRNEALSLLFTAISEKLKRTKQDSL